MQRCFTVSRLRGFELALVALLGAAVVGCRGVAPWGGDEEAIDPSAVATWWDGPRVRPGVALVIQVGTSATGATSMDAIVDQKGDVALPHLLQKPVHCDGMTLEELKAALVKAYAEFYRQPNVTVTFGPYDGQGVSPWGTVKVLGEIGNPGPVNMPPTMDMTVTKVIQAAGGLKPFADKTRIRVTRCEKDGRQQRIYVDLDDIGKNGRFDKDITLRPGDVVWIPQTWY